MAKRMLCLIAILLLVVILGVVLVLFSMKNNGLNGNGIYFVERSSNLCHIR